MTGILVKRWIAPEFGEQMQERERYGWKWMNNAMYPQYGFSRMKQMGMTCVDVRLEDEDVEADLVELMNIVNMFDKNQLGGQHRRCMCEKLKEFAIWGEVARSDARGISRRRREGGGIDS